MGSGAQARYAGGNTGIAPSYRPYLSINFTLGIIFELGNTRKAIIINKKKIWRGLC
jgi:hypothetical protein